MKSKILKVTALAVTLFSLLSCSSKQKKVNIKEQAYRKSAQENFSLLKKYEEKKNEAILNYISSLTPEEKIAQVFLINLEKDDNFFPVEWHNVNGKKKVLIPSGYIFFGYNISQNPLQIIQFTESIRNAAISQGTIPPFLSIDAEGGFVNRLRGVAGPLPENERVGSVVNSGTAYNLYDLYGKQLKALGFNLNLAPVSEICNESNAEFLSGRSYGTLEKVVEYSGDAILAYQKNKVAAVVKHFPGNTNVDPHIGLPKLDLNQDQLNEVLQCFSKVIEFNPEGVLMSHAIVPSVDKYPACLSKYWISDILRNQLGYEGIVFSDDIFMGALIKNGYNPETASRLAIESGINCIMISEKKFGKWMELLESICINDKSFMNKIEESVFKILKYKIKYGILKMNYIKDSDSFEVKIPDVTDQSKILERFFDFEKDKEKSVNLYNENFLKSASDEELRCLYIKK